MPRLSRQASLSITNTQSLLKLRCIESVMPPTAILGRPPLFMPSIVPSIRVISNESVLHIRWTKCWSLSFSLRPSDEYSGMISFRMDWLDSQESSPTLQLKSINSLPLSFLYGPTLTSIYDYWKNHTLNRQTFVGKVMSLFSNMLSRLVIVFLPRSKHLFISWL